MASSEYATATVTVEVSKISMADGHYADALREALSRVVLGDNAKVISVAIQKER
jgi:hypothetical protein